MSKQYILVTGGAGYVGSHLIWNLAQLKKNIIVLDNLSSGIENSVVYGKLIKGDIGDNELLEKIFNDYSIEAILHLAASISAPDSVTHPGDYYLNNTCHTLNLINQAVSAKVKYFVFASTAAVYGVPENNALIREDIPCHPINPYGSSKWMTEQMLMDIANANNFNFVAIRCFNIAGCNPELPHVRAGSIQTSALIKVACLAANGKIPHFQLYGTDYPTHDGTAIRDYVHVEDIASAFIASLNYLQQGGSSTILNCGYGHGYSVQQIIETVRRLSAREFVIRNENRRPGDAPEVVASNEKICKTLNWYPSHDDLEEIIRNTLKVAS